MSSKVRGPIVCQLSQDIGRLKRNRSVEPETRNQFIISPFSKRRKNHSICPCRGMALCKNRHSRSHTAHSSCMCLAFGNHAKLLVFSSIFYIVVLSIPNFVSCACSTYVFVIRKSPALGRLIYPQFRAGGRGSAKENARKRDSSTAQNKNRKK